MVVMTLQEMSGLFVFALQQPKYDKYDYISKSSHRKILSKVSWFMFIV